MTINRFWTNKIYTTLVLILLYGGSWWWFAGEASTWWPVLLFTYMVTGYGHFILGFFYQAQSIHKKTQEPWKNLAKIWSISLALAIPFFWTLQFTQWALYMMMGVVVYFLWHGALNEKTLFERESGKRADPLFYLIGAILFWWSVDSFQHASVFFDGEYLFTDNISPEMVSALVERLYLNEVWWFSLAVLIGLVFYFSWKAVRDEKPLNYIAIGALLLIAAVVWAAFTPLNFILLLSLILSYHFIMWWIYYAQVFIAKPNKSTLWYYLFWSVLVHGLAILVIGVGHYKWFESSALSTIYDFVFLIPVFLVTTFLHITTSFFNEDPVKRWLKIR